MPVLIGAYFITTLLLIGFFFLRGMTIFSLYYTPSCIWDSAVVSRRRSDAGFVTTAVKRPATEQREVDLLALIFCSFAM